MATSPTHQEFRIGALQIGPGGIAPDAVDALEPPEQFDLIVLPEIANVPYFPLGDGADEWLPEAGELAAVVAAYRRLARRAASYVVVGLALGGAGRWQNTAVVIDRAGELLPGRGVTTGESAVVYDKTHLCDIKRADSEFHESDYFRPGRELVTWELDFACLGTLICYDRHFSEAWRTLRSAGADIVAVPTASSVKTCEIFAPEIQTMAYQEMLYAVVANRVGREDLPGAGATTYLGRSLIVGPDGAVLAEAGELDAPAWVGAAIALEPVEQARTTMGFAANRRADIYLP